LFIVLVFGPASQPKKPGFCGFSRWESSILEKTRFLTPRHNQRNRVFAVFLACNEYSRKNPVSDPARNQRNRVFAGFLACNEYSRKNPVSDPTRNQRTKETGFLRGFSPVTSILEKTRFLTGR
jgi:hypothetical protein